MLLKYELQANCKWADGRQQNKVYKLPVLTLTLADFLSLSPQPPPPPPRPLHMEARSYTTYLDLKYSGYHKTLMQ